MLHATKGTSYNERPSKNEGGKHTKDLLMGAGIELKLNFPSNDLLVGKNKNLEELIVSTKENTQFFHIITLLKLELIYCHLSSIDGCATAI